MNYNIPEDEVENLLDIYWRLLGEVESKAYSDKDPLLMNLVEGGHTVLNRAGICDSRPRWEEVKEKEEKVAKKIVPLCYKCVHKIVQPDLLDPRCDNVVGCERISAKDWKNGGAAKHCPLF